MATSRYSSTPPSNSPFQVVMDATPFTTGWWNPPVDASPAVAADPDLVIEPYSNIDVDVMADLILGDIGGVELSKILRYDSFDGFNQVYSPMSQKSRIKPYSSNNLLGQEFSRMASDGSNRMNTAHYMGGEVARGLELVDQPPEYDVEIQVAIAGDWVPFSTTALPTEVT
jgi:hypothetical protein